MLWSWIVFSQGLSQKKIEVAPQHWIVNYPRFCPHTREQMVINKMVWDCFILPSSIYCE